MHLPKVAKKVRPPRMMHIKFPLGRTFGKAYNKELQTEIVKALLDFAVEGGIEEEAELAYRWKDYK